MRWPAYLIYTRLSARKSSDAEWRAWGAKSTGHLPIITAFANLLFQKGILSPEALALKMAEVEKRFQEEESSRTSGT
jgi:hypothetical protein